MLVQPQQAATVCELDLVLHTIGSSKRAQTLDPNQRPENSHEPLNLTLDLEYAHVSCRLPIFGLPDPGMTVHPGLDRLKTRIQGLRSKTTDNGCTEAEALLAATKVAELLDRNDLSLTYIEILNSPCEQREYQTYRKKRIPLDDCVSAVANFCDCRVWREKRQAGEARYVF